MVGPTFPLVRCFYVILGSTELSLPKSDYIYPILAIFGRSGGETQNTSYGSEDREDRRGAAAGAAPGCPFDSIDIISSSTMMKME
jgi:hypothetical protein